MKLCRWTQNWRETRPRRQKMRLECGERKSRREENLQICLRPTEPLGKPAALLLYYSHNIEVNYIGALTVGAVQFQFVNQKQKQQRIFWTTADVISSNLIKHISTGLHDEAVTNSLSVHQIKVSAVSFFFFMAFERILSVCRMCSERQTKTERNCPPSRWWSFWLCIKEPWISWWEHRFS